MNCLYFSLVIIVLNVRDEIESKYPSILFWVYIIIENKQFIIDKKQTKKLLSMVDI